MSQDNNNCEPNCPCGQYRKGEKKKHATLPNPERKPAWEWFDDVQKKIPLVRSFGSLNASWPDTKRIRIYNAQENGYFTTTVAEYRDNWWMLN